MVVIFGHSPQYGYLNTVQEYSFGLRKWQIVETVGFPVRGGYGHSSAYDPLTNSIYVYGGYVFETHTQVLTNRIYSYHPNYREWRLLTAAPSARFFHTGVFVSGGLMLVFGGNTHNDTLHSHGARCYSADTIAYDVTCDSWHQFPMPREMVDLPRYGHSATVFEKSMYIYGGFDGQMLSDMLRYTPGNCEHLLTQNQCLVSRTGVKCIWDKKGQRCMQITNISHQELQNDDIHHGTYMQCVDEPPPRGMTSHEELCKLFTDCAACVQTSYNCVWCGETCSHEICPRNLNSPATIRDLDQCEAHSGDECLQLHTCHACSSNQHCIWSWTNAPDRCRKVTKMRDVKITMNNTGTIQAQRLTMENPCRSPCVELTSCRNCTESDCIWCQNEARCVDKDAYPASFPYGQCREWTTLDGRCRATETGKEWCSFYLSCSTCRSDPGCGWCDDGSGTGKGKCMPGGARGPSSRSLDTCPIDRWYFTKCPSKSNVILLCHFFSSEVFMNYSSVCQCNGHSQCLPNSSVCIQPCADLTNGTHCERCIAGYYGSPLNGATCQREFRL